MVRFSANGRPSVILLVVALAVIFSWASPGAAKQLRLVPEVQKGSPSSEQMTCPRKQLAGEESEDPVGGVLLCDRVEVPT